jgi:hypothetical protein
MRSSSAGRLAVQDRLEDHRRGLPRERQSAGARLVQNRSQREEVGAGVRDLPARLLGRHVGHRAQCRARARELVRLHRGGRLGVLAPRRPHPFDLRKAEVEHLGLAARRDEDVGGLEVAVHDPFRVRRLQRVRDLDPDVEQRTDLAGTPPDPVREGFSLEQLHRDEVLPLVLVDLVDRADPRVIERGRGPGLALETLERGRVLGHFRGQELERNVPAELRVLGLVHDAHPSAAQLRRDLVVGDGLADHAPPFASGAGYNRSNSGSPWRRARSGSRRAQSGSRKPASQDLRIASSASAFLPSWQKTQAAL